MVERGVVIGGVMICGSFLLAALLNRSAMEEMPVRPAPAAVMAPMNPAAETQVAPGVVECAKGEVDARPSVAQTEHPPAKRCRERD
jgi:hypothetical protein